MKKKLAKKAAAKSPQRRTRLSRKSSVGSVQYTRYIVISFAVILLVLVASFGPKALDRPHVLGASVYLADHGSNSDSGGGDTSGSSDSSGSNSGSSTNSGSGSSGDSRGRACCRGGC